MMFAEPEGSTESIPHPLAKPAVPAPAAPVVAFSPEAEGDEIAATAEPYLAYLTDVSRQLGVIDPVETYFRPLIGRWGDLGAVAQLTPHRVRRAAVRLAEADLRPQRAVGLAGDAPAAHVRRGRVQVVSGLLGGPGVFGDDHAVHP